MEFFTVVFCVVHRLDKRVIFKKIAVGYCFRYFREVLINDSARSHIEMSDFAVAHLTVGQTDAHTACAERRRGVLVDKRVYVFASVNGNSVSSACGSKSVTVHNYYCVRYFLFHTSPYLSKFTIFAKSSFNEAPPISPPSISG